VKVAGRMANVLKTGRAVRDLSSFNDCAVILICAPDTGLGRAVELLENAPIEWSRKVVLFCASNVSSIDFTFFQEHGASVGSLNTFEVLPKCYVVEGSREALRAAKVLVKDLKGRAVEVDSGRMRLFDAARTFSTSLFTPLIDSCFECIHEAGIESKEAARLAEALLLRSLRSYMHSGRRGWTGPAATRDWAAVERQYEALKSADARQAEYFRDSARHAFALYQSFPELARYLSKCELAKGELAKDRPVKKEVGA
jgi:hypothetical protein